MGIERDGGKDGVTYFVGDAHGSCPPKDRLTVRDGKGGKKLAVCPCACALGLCRTMYTNLVKGLCEEDPVLVATLERWADTTML